jgi:hypothetical protein
MVGLAVFEGGMDVDVAVFSIGGIGGVGVQAARRRHKVR